MESFNLEIALSEDIYKLVDYVCDGCACLL